MWSLCFLVLLLKAQPLCTRVQNQISETRVLGEVEKDSFITLPGNGGHTGFCLEKLYVPTPEDLMRVFITMTQGGECAGRSLPSPHLRWSPRLELLWPLQSRLRWFLGCSPLISNCSIICPLELRGGHGGWSLAYRNGGQEGLGAWEPHRAPLSFSFPICTKGMRISAFEVNVKIKGSIWKMPGVTTSHPPCVEPLPSMCLLS